MASFVLMIDPATDIMAWEPSTSAGFAAGKYILKINTSTKIISWDNAFSSATERAQVIDSSTKNIAWSASPPP